MKKPKKILLLISAMSSGGAERVASTLANAWVSQGDQVVLMPTFSGRGDCFYPLSADVRLVYLADRVSSRARTWIHWGARLLALRRFIASERPDVIVSFLTNVNVAAVMASLGLRVPVIICERVDPFAMPIPLVWRLACRLIYPRANMLMVQTQAVADKFASSGFSLPRVRVVPNPIPDALWAIQREGGVSPMKRLISVGRLGDQKQFDVLIKVFASIAGRYPDWALQIIGEGSLRPLLQQQISDLGLEARVVLTGRTGHIGEVLAGADVFVLASKYEGFPNVLLEAMAVGLPCIAFDCPSGPRDISLEGQVALLVPLNDEKSLGLSLERLMKDPGLRDSLGKRGRASVLERFSLARVLEQWNVLFREVGVQP